MGDMSELRTLTVIGGFVGVFLLFVTLIPTNFLITGYDDYRSIEYASDYWDADLIKRFADFYNGTIDGGDYHPEPHFNDNMGYQLLDDGDGDFGGYEEFYIVSDYDSGSATQGAIAIRYPLSHAFGLEFLPLSAWDFVTWHHLNKTAYDTDPLDIYNVDSSKFITKGELDAYWNANDRNHTIFHVKGSYFDNQPFTMEVHISYNTTTYGSPQIAWNSDDLHILVGVNFDQTVSSYNAWDLISALLFFNVPQILGGTPAFLGNLLSILTWIPVIYVTFILLLRLVGAVFGGGA